MMGLKVADLENAIMKELQEYKQEVTDGLKQEVAEVAKECVADIKQLAPKRFGKYRRSWRATVAHEGFDDIRIVVHSVKHYRLAHLLEHGHAGPGGTSKGSAKPIPHISIAERIAAEKLFKKVKVVVKGCE